MLKRLFISLIILSALTSEGIIDLSGNIYKVCYDIDKSVDILEAVNLLLSDMPKDLENQVRLSLEENKDGFIVMSTDEVISLKHKCSGIYLSKSSNMMLLPVLYPGLENASILVEDKNSVLKKSDNSPPFNFNV
ncbi:MAG: hypothetical protein N2645_12210 [Clostridia bacterium]|nr:hypothetical protein [Clostridia bacterium]